MSTSFIYPIIRALTIGLVAAGIPVVMAAETHGFHSGRDDMKLAEKVRRAVAVRYSDIHVAENETPEAWVHATGCVSGPNEGAMGVHLVKMSRVGDAVLNAEEPEALIYEPLANGGHRLVGVEFILLAANFPSDPPGPSLEGQHLNYVGSPNRYNLPAFYELHVWFREDNPKGTFADWHTRVSCEKQSGN